MIHISTSGMKERGFGTSHFTCISLLWVCIHFDFDHTYDNVHRSDSIESYYFIFQTSMSFTS